MFVVIDVTTLCQVIIYAREAGFDFLRIHIKLDDPLFLYYADKLGMLLMQDFPNFGEGGDTPLGRRRFVEMMKAGIRRDFNHPSIISWCIFNESWGFGGQTELIKWFNRNHSPAAAREKAVKIANASAFKWIHETWLLAKELDPTRLIEDMSVVIWDHLDAYGHVDTDIMQKIAASAAADGILRFCCAVDESPHGGLTVYDYDAGRFPIAPTICIEWEQG